MSTTVGNKFTAAKKFFLFTLMTVSAMGSKLSSCKTLRNNPGDSTEVSILNDEERSGLLRRNRDNDTLPRITCPRFPMVFHHGFMGGKRNGTFVGITDHFGKNGCKILVTEVSAVNSAEFRAVQLKSQIDRFMASNHVDKVHIIAHSQGGLDARYAISVLGLSNKVASLSTLATPHYGTILADEALENTGPIAQRALAVLINLMGRVVNSHTQEPDTIAAINSLTVKYMTETFNSLVVNAPEVIYQSWGARTGDGSGDPIKAILLNSHNTLNQRSGSNDGVVSVHSAAWGDYKGTIAADHLDLIGIQILDRRSPFDHLQFLDSLALDLVAKGL